MPCNAQISACNRGKRLPFQLYLRYGTMFMADYVYLYAVGDAVLCELLHSSKGVASCSIIRQMPPLGTQMQYRIKFDDEKFERVVVETQLTKLDVAA